MNTLKRTRITTTGRTTAREFPLARVRNLGIAAHIDAGKTTLTERILFHAGAIHGTGEVHDGNTTTDFNPLEQQKGITIFAATVPAIWTQAPEEGVAKLFPGAPHRLNLIDTPGHVDFTAEVERSLRVLDGMIAVFSGVEGVQPQSETVWRQADKYRVPRLVFVNKMDRTGADFARVLADIRQKLGARAAAVLLPWGAESALRGQFDVVNRRALFTEAGVRRSAELPEEARPAVEAARSELVATLADVDDTIATLWLQNDPVPAEVLKPAIRRATLANRFVPVAGGSAYKFVGVEPLLDAVVDYLPAPVDVPAQEVPTPEGSRTLSLRADDQGPLAALAFKLVIDGQAGRLVWVRVYSGALRKGDTVLNPRTGKTERAGRLVRIVADRHEELSAVSAGEICGVAGLRGFTTGDTLCAEDEPLLLEPPSFPEPVVTVALEPQSARDREKLSTALARLADEDPTFRVSTHPETGQCLIAGMGELHLDIMRLRLADDFGIATQAGAPEIAHRETISRPAEGDHLLRKQNGGVGMYARIALSVSPRERGAGLAVENRVTGGRIPAQFLNAVHKGIEEAARSGVLGFPLVDVQVTILDGDAHVKDSNELAFRLAAMAALREATQAAGPVLLEPVMRIEVEVPGEHQGDILGDLTRRRGKILGLEAQRGLTLVTAEAPLAEMFGYANAIRSLSKGRASYSMKPERYDPVPANKGANGNGR